MEHVANEVKHNDVSETSNEGVLVTLILALAMHIIITYTENTYLSVFLSTYLGSHASLRHSVKSILVLFILGCSVHYILRIRRSSNESRGRGRLKLKLLTNDTDGELGTRFPPSQIVKLSYITINILT